MNKKFKQFLDSLDDELFLAWLSANYGTTIPKWEECSREEYVEHCGTYGIDHDVFTEKDFELAMYNLFSSETYKVEPIYNDFHGGLLNWIKLQDRKPDGHKFYKQVGEEFTIILGGDLFEYCKTRGITKPFLIKRRNDYGLRKEI